MDVDEANRLLNAVDWGPVFNSDCPDEQWTYLLAVARPIFDTLAPVKRRIVRNPTAPPVTDATKQLMERRRAALRDGDRDAYKGLNRQAQSAIRRDTREAIERLLREARPCNMWRAVQSVIGSRQSSRVAPSADATALNRYFAAVGRTTASQVVSAGPELPVRLPRVAAGRFQVEPVSPDELRWVVNCMSDSASCGADGLCVRFVKLCMPSLCPVITHIVNSSIISQFVPDSWKLAIVHPVQKSPKSTDVSNFRPISILPTIAKQDNRAYCA